MATGKSTVGQLVASRLNWKFVDIDDLIVSAAGMPITEIFETEGESGFRKREHLAVIEAASLEQTVIATGGGVVLDHRNLQELARSSLMVCLSLSAEETYERVRHDSSRPLLQHSDPLTRITDLMAERHPHYARIPYQIKRDDLTPEQTATQIVELYNQVSSVRRL
jgi:shikimate kinase